MAKLTLCFVFSLLVFHVQSKPANDPNKQLEGGSKIPDKTENVHIASRNATVLTYTIDYFLVRKELQYALQDVIAYKEATTSILDPLTDPEPEVATQTRFVLDGLRIIAFYAYDKLIFLANAKLLTLAYATQTFGWYESAFTHFTDRIGVLIEELDDTTRDNLQLLLNQIISQTNLHHYDVQLLLTPD